MATEPQTSPDTPQRPAPLYSVTAHAVVGFLGGPLALACFTMLSLRRAGLLRAQAALLSALGLVAVAISLGLGYLMAAGLPEGLLLLGEETHTTKLYHRLSGLALFGFVYLALKQQFEHSKRQGPPPKPWAPGLLCAFLGSILYVFVGVGMRLVINN